MKETLVGILFFVFVGILLWFTVAVKGVGLIGEEVYHFDVLFKNVQSLKKGDPVVFAGLEVGSVEAIRYDAEKNRVRASLKVKGVQIPRNSKITVINSTLFGGKAVSISRPEYPEKKYYETNKTYYGEEEKGLMESLTKLGDNLNKTIDDIREDLRKTISNAENATGNLAKITEKINRGQGTLGRLVNDDKMGKNLQEITTNLQKATKDLSRGEGTLGRLISDKKMGRDVQNITSNVSDITGKISRGEGTLGRLVNDDKIYRNLSRIAGNVDQLLEKVVRGEGTMGKLFTDDKLYTNLADVTSNARTITADIVNQKGLLGRAISDEKVGDNFAETMQNLRQASESIRNIADKIDSGTGTIGTLVNSREFLDTAQSAIKNLDQTLGKAARAETVVGVGYFYHDEQKLGAAKGYLRLVPTRTRYFQVGATLFFPDDEGPIGFDEQDKDDGELIIFPEIQLSKLFYFNDANAESWDDLILTFRIGLLEGQVGGGVDLDFLDNFRLTMEARAAHSDEDEFDENINRYLARAYFSFRFFKYFRGYVGVDNFIENGALSFGLTTEWYDEDIKTLVSLVGLAN